MRNHPDVPMRRRHFPHLAFLADGSLIPSVDLVGHSTGPALASAGSLPLYHLIKKVAGCTLFDNDRQCAQTVLAALTQDSPLDIVCTRLHDWMRPPAHARPSAVCSAPDESISVSDPPDLSDSASDSASDSDTASFHSVCSDSGMSRFATDAPDSVCSNPELISGSAETAAVIVTHSDLQSFLSSDICQCTTRHRCSCQVGRDDWSAVRRVRPGIIGPSTLPVLLPFQRNQHSWVATRAQHVLRSGRVRTYDPWQDTLPSREDFSPTSHTQARYVQRVVGSDGPSQDTECVRYRLRLDDEYKPDVLSGVVPYREHDVVRRPYGYARVQLKAGALPKRQRRFPHAGERGEALGKIIRINLHKPGWLEELSSGSEWCSPPFTVPKPVPKKTPLLDKWRMVIDFQYLNSQTQDSQALLPLI